MTLPSVEQSASLQINPVRGVIMAGGRSERMRSSNGPSHKALVKVAGMSLLERNLLHLFAAEIKDVVVVISANELAIANYVSSAAFSIAERYQARLEIFLEQEPLGNIGVVRALNDGQHDLFVVYVDNLTSIAAGEVLARHRATSAAMTITTHVWRLQNPFGELEIEGGYVQAYREKPVRNVRISSGTCVVSPAAAALAPEHGQFGAAQLCAAVLASSLPIAAYEHSEPWVDVNDYRAIAEAEAMIQQYPERFQL